MYPHRGSYFYAQKRGFKKIQMYTCKFASCRVLVMLMYHQTCLSPPVCLLTVPRMCFFCESSVFIMFRSCRYAFLSDHCSIVVTCLERANLLALLYVTFSCVIVTFPCDVLGQVWYLIVSIPDLCFLTYFY